MREVVAVGAGMTRFGKQNDRSLKDLCSEAVRAALDDGGLGADEVGAVFYGNAIAGLVTGQEMMRGQSALAGLGLGGRPMFNVENACASGGSAVHLAFQAVASGTVDCALAVGAETMTAAERSVVLAAIGTARDLSEVGVGIASSDEGALPTSPFMELYGQLAQRAVNAGRVTVQHLAEVSRKNHRNGNLNPLAQYGLELTLEEILHSPMVAEPLTRLMCAPISDGAAVVALCSADTPVGKRPRAVPVLASAVVSGRSHDGSSSQSVAAAIAYASCGLTPGEVDFAEVHDATAVAELVAYEELGLAPPGGAGDLLESGETGLNGRIPVNPSGGLLSKGHPIGATGVAQLVELIEQIRGDAGKRQVPRHGIGLAANQGGWSDGQPTVAAVHILGTMPR
jgi:acetyl-CoA acetyltransferase